MDGCSIAVLTMWFFPRDLSAAKVPKRAKLFASVDPLQKTISLARQLMVAAIDSRVLSTAAAAAAPAECSELDGLAHRDSIVFVIASITERSVGVEAL